MMTAPTSGRAVRVATMSSPTVGSNVMSESTKTTTSPLETAVPRLRWALRSGP